MVLLSARGYSVQQIAGIFEVGEDLSWMRGKHAMKMGFSIKRIHYNQIGNQFALGGFDFDGTATQNPASRVGTGVPMADFLLGLSSQSYTAVQPADAQLRSTYWSGYFGDTWRVTRSITFGSSERTQRSNSLRATGA